MEERRKIQRPNLSLYMQVINTETEELLGHLVEITPIGLRIDSQAALPIGVDFSLRLDLTSDIAEEASISFTARSKWCQQEYVEPFIYEIGMEITAIDPQGEEIIHRIIEKYITRN